eukprot:1139326-Pelagomonas_calceolata.AAC.1
MESRLCTTQDVTATGKCVGNVRRRRALSVQEEQGETKKLATSDIDSSFQMVQCHFNTRVLITSPGFENASYQTWMAWPFLIGTHLLISNLALAPVVVLVTNTSLTSHEFGPVWPSSSSEMLPVSSNCKENVNECGHIKRAELKPCIMKRTQLCCQCQAAAQGSFSLMKAHRCMKACEKCICKVQLRAANADGVKP